MTKPTDNQNRDKQETNKWSTDKDKQQQQGTRTGQESTQRKTGTGVKGGDAWSTDEKSSNWKNK